MEISSLIGVVAGVVTGVIAIVTGIKKFYQYVILPIKEHFEKVHQVIEDVSEIKKKLAYELNANGGKSMKDQMTLFGKQLMKQEGLILAILSSSDRFIIIFDENGGALWCNETFDRELGWNIAEVLGNGWKNVISAEDRERVSREFLDTVKDGRDFIMEFNYIHRNIPNKKTKIKAYCHPIKRNSGEIIAFLSFASEIS